MPFTPRFSITAQTAACLMRIEAARERVEHLPITVGLLASLRETARLRSTHFSTQIEGNLLTLEQVDQVIAQGSRLPGRERERDEVLGYYAALESMERLAAGSAAITEKEIQTLHALVMGGGKTNVKPTPYRDGQNIIREGGTRAIVYLPPEAKDVPRLMGELVDWLNSNEAAELPCPLRAGIAHYQFATIHPYYDGNGRTARLLTTRILQSAGYGLKGLYSLEEYYARNLAGYYAALAVGPSHNYYLGRAEAEITGWIDYLCAGMARSFEHVQQQAAAAAAAGALDDAEALRQIDPRQRRALALFRQTELISSRDLQTLFLLSQRAARDLLTAWTERGFIVVANSSRKGRRYRLAEKFERLRRGSLKKS